VKIPKLIYFLVLLLLIGCAKADLNLRIQEDEALQIHNGQFFDENQQFYGKVDKRKITVKALGGSPMDDASYKLLRADAKEIYTYLFNLKLIAVGESETGFNDGNERMDLISAQNAEKMHESVDWDKTKFQSTINYFFDAIASVPEKDSLHQKLKQASEIKYERIYTEANLLEELSDLKYAIAAAAEALQENTNRMRLLEFMNLTTTSILLAERKVLRFLNEHYLNINMLGYPERLETVITIDKNSYSRGENIQMDVFPSYISSPNLYSKHYVIEGPELVDSFLIKGSLSYQSDTVWLPTEKEGVYKVTGSSKNFLRPSQIHEFEYNYQVITE